MRSNINKKAGCKAGFFIWYYCKFSGRCVVIAGSRKPEAGGQKREAGRKLLLEYSISTCTIRYKE